MTAPRLALLDRDGTLNVKAPEGEYVTRPEDLVLLPGAAEAVRRLNDAGVAVAVVTNQRCIALGLVTPAELDEIHATLVRKLDETAGARVDGVFHCPHDEGACDCRKPAPGLLVRAAAQLGVPPAESIMIGDAESDVVAGRSFGAYTVRLTNGRTEADATAPDLLSAVRAALG
jgi:D-glycero-D-manno-heptose 1,7-bisphosphate phosphatase